MLVAPHSASHLCDTIGYDVDQLAQLLEGKTIKYRRMSNMPWAVEICVYAANVIFFAGGACGIALMVAYFMQGNVGGAIFVLGAGILCVGLGLLMMWVCRESTRLMVVLTKKIWLGIKKMFVRKERA